MTCRHLSLALVVLLAACGGGGITPTPTPTPTRVETSTGATDADTTTTLDSETSDAATTPTPGYLNEGAVAGTNYAGDLFSEVQRYAALTDVASTDRIKVTFWPSDPNS